MNRTILGFLVVAASALSVSWLALPTQAQDEPSPTTAVDTRATDRAAYVARLATRQPTPKQLAAESRARQAANCEQGTRGWIGGYDDTVVACLVECTTDQHCPSGARCVLSRPADNIRPPDEPLYADDVIASEGGLEPDETGLCFAPRQLFAEDSPMLVDALAAVE